MKGKQTTAAHWRKHFSIHASSGLTVSAYLRREGIRSSQWYYWQKRLRSDAIDASSLVPVHIVPEYRPAMECRIHLPNGIMLEFGGKFSLPDVLQDLLSVVR